jgi:PAS domain S-box-containing protein
VLDTIFGIGPDADRSVKGWEGLIHSDDREMMGRYFAEEVIGRRQRFDREYRIVRPSDGAERWVHGVGRLEFDADGAPVRMIGTIRDITVHRHAELERARLQAQLLQAQKMESVGRLAGGVAHDFNNMLGAILGYVELALEHPGLSDALRSDLFDIQKAAQRSAALTSELLAFARRQNIAPRVIDLNETISGLLKMLRRLLGEDIDLLWKPGADLWPVRLDPSQVNQVLANLCVNARDAIAGVGHIVVETSHAVFDAAYCETHTGFTQGEYVRLSVSDSGHGMDRTVLAHLFEPFFTTKRQGEGTGLGLATVYGIVKQNDGFINVYSEPGQGTTFTIYFPRHRGPDVAEPATFAAVEAADGHGTILLVEDEPAMLRVTALGLASLGYDVLAAATPADALRIAASHEGRIDLVLTDVVMPEMHGRELIARLRESRPGIASVYMSGYTADVISRRGVLDEGLRFIQKPFSKSDLAATLREALTPTA